MREKNTEFEIENIEKSVGTLGKEKATDRKITDFFVAKTNSPD